MFEGEKVDGALGYPSQTSKGLWKVHVGSRQYRAWKFWLAASFRKKEFPEPVMVVWGEWPPRSWEGAALVAQTISEIRDGTYGKDPRPIGGLPVPRGPEPWNGHIPAEIAPPPIIENLAERRRQIIEHYLAGEPTRRRA